MNVLILGPTPSPLRPIIEDQDCRAVEYSEPVDVEFLRERSIGFAVSYSYRHLVKKPVIEYLKGNIINLHISVLPWNRGSDPNLWSFLENTPKGVTIHYVDQDLDTGDIICQKEISFEIDSETLASTYAILNSEIIELFRMQWPLIIQGKCSRQKQSPGGSYHSSRDKEAFMHLLANKSWDTPVKNLMGKALIHSEKET